MVASAPIRRNESACQVAAHDFADDAVAAVVLEWREPVATLPERPGQFTSRVIPVQPPPALECFNGSGASVQFVDHGRAFGAYLLVGRDAPAPLVDEARRLLETLHVDGQRGDLAPQLLDRNGITLAVPPGWDGRVLFREASSRHGVIFQVANFELPANAGLEPPRELPPGQEDQIKAMTAGESS